VRDSTLAVARLGAVVAAIPGQGKPTDYGLYDFLRVITFYARRRPGETVRLACHPRANLHLMPIDLTVARLLALATEPLDRPVFHLVGGGSVLALAVFAAINAHLPITLVAATPQLLQELPFTRFEAAVNMQVKYTAVYLRYHYGFQIRPPQPAEAVTPDVLDRLIAWYVSEGLPA